jgi:hypothetical protein
MDEQMHPLTDGETDETYGWHVHPFAHGYLKDDLRILY